MAGNGLTTTSNQQGITMKLITARNSNKKCNGYKGCGDVVFTGFRYIKLRRKKIICERCYDEIESKKDDNFWQKLINKFKG